MFLQFTGISVLIHLIIIGVAKVLNMLRKTEHKAAFQTYNMQGGLVKSELTNRAISFTILFLMAIYVIGLFTVVVSTALRLGENGPQMMFYAFVGSALTEIALYLWVHALVVASVILGTVSFVFAHESRFMQRVSAKILSAYKRGTASFVSYVHIVRSVTLIVKLLFIEYCRVLTKSFSNYVAMQFVRVKGTLVRPLEKVIHVGKVPTSIQKRSLWFLIGLALGGSAVVFPNVVSAQIVEPGFESEVVVGALNLATAIASTQDGRIFIAEKSGVVRVVKNGVLLSEPLVTLTDINTFGDRGLLGLAVDPNFSSNGYVYLSYTYENTPGLNIAGPKTGRIVRLTVIGDTASESSKFVLVGAVGGTATTPSCEDFIVTSDCIPSDSNSHSVGGLRFGPDGKLYASLGDGADFTDVDPRALRAQNIDSLGGKVLRINTDGTAPADNPFYDGNPNANRSKVYALGLRNMFRFNFHPVTGLLFGGDVGWSNWEEINLISAGKNYGWPCREGDSATLYGCSPSSTATNPVYTYAHNSAGAGSVTGGAFMSNGAYPTAYANSFFIGDYAQMWMKRLELTPAGAFVSVNNFNTDVFPVEIFTGEDGHVYYIDIVFGTLNRLTHTSGNRRPVVNVGATPTSGLTPLNVSFSSVGTNDPDGNPISYAWQFGDGATSTVANPSHTYVTNGAYDASLVVTDSLGASTAKSVRVTVGNQAPTGTITSPSSGSLYEALGSVTVTGTGTDPETGVLPNSAFSWTVILHHNTHTHTVQQFTNTKTITFIADDHNDTDVYMEIILTVTDSVGLKNTKSINMYLNNGVGSGNLVSNPSVEIEGLVPSSPLNWFQGWFGAMNPIFTYPTTGLSGSKAASINVTSYTSGAARWYFTPAFVTAGATYDFSNLYTATVPTEVTVQLGRADGTYQYVYLGALPATPNPTRTNFSFVVPAGIETATVFHEITAVGVLTVDDYVLALTGSGDVIPPTGSITSPTENSVLSGTVAVSVNAADDVAVGSVHLAVDGVEVGVGDSESPYSIFLDTTTLTDGAHTLTAHVHDTSGNEASSLMINVTVSNTKVNLFTNGDLEIQNGQYPLGWTPGGSGTHTAVYTYPITGASGSGKAAQIQVTKYDLNDTGDARWVHAPVPVQSGIKYTYETMYMATTITDVLGRYRFANGSQHFFGLIKEIPGTATWTKIEGSFVPPVGAVDVTFGHAISAGGATMAFDDVKLYENGTGTPSEINAPTVDFISPIAGAILSGTVTLTATSSDDTAVVGVFFAVNGSPVGVEDLTAPYQTTLNTTTYPNGTYILKATTRDPYGNNSNKTISVTINNTTPPTGTSTNLVLNPGFETAGTGGNPANWSRGGWGTNTRTFTYPVAGATGNGASLTVSGYTSGDAKWYFKEVLVTPGTQYTVSDKYNSTVASQALIRYTLASGVNQYLSLGNLTSTGGTWQTLSRTFTPPANTVSMTLFHLIAGNGTIILDDVSVTGPGSTPAPDTTLPVASVTSPSANATVSGVVNVSATATDNVSVSGVTLLVDGNPTGIEDTTAPYSFTWNTASIANGLHTISVRARDAAGNLGTAPVVNVTITNSTSTPTDTTAPTTSITAPTGGATISGISTVNVTATDAVGVTGVTLFVDGNVVGTPDTTVPYSFAFDTTILTNGAHTISARATDAAGNQGTAPVVNVTITNSTTPPTGNNLVINGSLETAGTGGNPANWSRGGWGTNTRTFTYPVAGATGNGAQIDVTAYTDGDAKWFFDPVSVLPNTQYTVGDKYNSTIASQMLIRYTLQGGTFQYQSLGQLPATVGVWNTFSQTITTPANATALTVFHLIAGNGSLIIDDMSVIGASGPTPDTISPATSVTTPTANATVSGTVSIGATATDNVGVTDVTLLIDGSIVGSADTSSPYSFSWDSTSIANGVHIVSVRAKDAAGNTTNSEPVTVNVNNMVTPPTGNNLVINGSLETAGTGGNPANWSRGGWGTNTRTFTYPVAGATGNGAQIDVTAYTDGDAKWFFDPVSVIAGNTYTFSYQYKSSVATNLTIRYTMTNGSFVYVGVANPAASATWANASVSFVPPVGATSVTVFHIINAVGTLSVDEQSIIGG